MDQNIIKNVVSGVLVIDKPVGLTSHDVVQIVRRGTGIRRAGHTGTLDPRASGVLVVLVGPAVRLSQFVSATDKRYQATIKLGSSTDTYDAEGIPTEEKPVEITEEKFAELLRDTKWMFKEGECDFGNAHDEFYPVYAFIPNEDGIALDEYLRDSTKNNKGRTSTFAKSDYNYIESNTEGQGICFDLEDSGIQNNILTPGETYYIQYFDDQPAHTIGDKILVSSDPNFDNDHLWNILNSFFSEGGSDGGCLAYGSSEAILA